MSGNQGAQEHQHGADVGRQHQGRLPCRPRSGSCARESPPAPCPFDDVAHGQAGAVAVTPGGPSMGRRMVSAFTLPRCQRLSSSARCLTATWARVSRCCILQPPQAPPCRPKCGQPGRTRCGGLAVDVRQAGLFPVVLLRWVLALTHSERQGTINEDHLAVGLAGHALGIQVHGLDGRPALGKIGLVCGVLKGWGEWFGLFAHPRLSQARSLVQPRSARRSWTGRGTDAGLPARTDSLLMVSSQPCKSSEKINLPPGQPLGSVWCRGTTCSPVALGSGRSIHHRAHRFGSRQQTPRGLNRAAARAVTLRHGAMRDIFLSSGISSKFVAALCGALGGSPPWDICQPYGHMQMQMVAVLDLFHHRVGARFTHAGQLPQHVACKHPAFMSAARVLSSSPRHQVAFHDLWGAPHGCLELVEHVERGAVQQHPTNTNMPAPSFMGLSRLVAQGCSPRA